MEGIQEKTFALNKLSETRPTSLHTIPETKTSVELFREQPAATDRFGESDAQSSTTAAVFDAIMEERRSIEELEECRHLLGNGSSTFLREIYPMKAFSADQIKLFEQDSISFSDNVDVVDDNVRTIRSTYLLEMFPMKSFEISNFQNNLASAETTKPLRIERADETEIKSTKSNFFENVNNTSFACLKLFGLFRK